MTDVHPRDQDDPFCTCPKCGLLGTHHVDIVAVTGRPGTVRMTHPALPGQPVDVPTAGVPGHERAGWSVSSRRAVEVRGVKAVHQAERVCVFCGHLWYTAADDV